ncbi:MAG: two-component sensor histidine kinase, partial [Betaproteobacteria bacterium]
ALRYAGEPVEIEVLTRNPSVAIEVRDQGPGIPVNEVERLKRPFTRLDDSRSGAGGAGLGLAIVERTAQAHGGSLELAPRAPRGLIARLVLSTK